MNVPDTKFSRNTMKLLNHNTSTLMLFCIFCCFHLYFMNVPSICEYYPPSIQVPPSRAYALLFFSLHEKMKGEKKKKKTIVCLLPEKKKTR